MNNTDQIDPVVDIERLLDISQYDIQSPALHARLDLYARRAAEELAMPLGMVSIVLDSAQYIAGSHGIGGWIAEAEGTPVEWSFCANVVRSGDAYVVENAAIDPLQYDNPLVTEDGIRSYAGVPLVSPAGKVLGACCVAGVEPRAFTAAELARLTVLSNQIIDEITARPADRASRRLRAT